MSVPPVIDDKFFSKFSGLLINGPEQVIWPKEVDPNDYPVGPFGTTHGPIRLMVAELVRTEYKTLGLNGDTSDHVILVAINRETSVTYSGKMPQPNFLPPPDIDNTSPELARSEAELNALITNYFNFDLVHDLGLPITVASYEVYAMLGKIKSNTLMIKTKVEE